MSKKSKEYLSKNITYEEESDDNSLDDKEQGEDNTDKFQKSKDVSMEDLLALQDKIGTKAFTKRIIKMKKERMKPEKKCQANTYKRANKNCPLEAPLQRKCVPIMRSFAPKTSTKVKHKTAFRDPRFDDLSGKLDSIAWKKNYQFLLNLRKREKNLLVKELKKQKNPKKCEQLKLAIQRMSNQEREIKKREQERMIKKQQRDEAIALMKEGYKPRFIKHKENKLAHKISHFEELTKNNKLEKYLQRKEKKLKKKEFS